MGSIPIARSILMPILLLLGLLAAPLGAQDPPDPKAPSAESLVARGNALYFRGEHEKALEAYSRAVAVSSHCAAAWLNGGALLEDLGRPGKAARWYGRAADLAHDPGTFNALGWAHLHAGELQEAATSFQKALERQGGHAYALLGLSRAELESSHPREALELLKKARESAPLLNLIPFYQGRAYELLGDWARAAEAYRQAVIADSYFLEGRDALARAYMRKRDYNDAWRQLVKLLDAEPRHRRFQVMMQKVQPLLTRAPSILRPSGLHLPIPYLAASGLAGGRIPRLRIGIGTTPRGKPRPRQSLNFHATSDFVVLDAATGRLLARGAREESWRLGLRRGKKGPLIAAWDASGKMLLQRRQAILIRTQSRFDGVIALDDVRYPGAGPDSAVSGRLLRGDLEIAALGSRLRLVNILDLENYTHGVLSAEMPIQSPIEALKAQAVVARSHALFIKEVTRRHRRDGYDLCDEQHCQVYAGARAESPRSREIVEATRGRIVVHKTGGRDRVAHVIYSSNCGGFTQSGKDLAGWGDVPYWSGVADGNGLGERPRSPWELRTRLMESPQAYCQPSNYVHPSHFRWTRIIPFKDLEEKLNRKLRIGKLLALRPLRRSSSGNVNLLWVRGTDRKVKIDSETQIRGLLGIGSLRSTLFVMDTEYGPGQKPRTLVFHGGGWGHGVGLCQSGSMGRAEAGQGYEEIVKAYFKGTKLGQLDY